LASDFDKSSVMVFDPPEILSAVKAMESAKNAIDSDNQ